MPAELTIIIPAKNEEHYLGGLLDSLAAQDYELMPATRILVADGGSTDRTRKVAESYRDRLNLKVIEGGSPAAGRNRGAELADTPYLLFVDADVVLRPHSIRRAMYYMKNRGWHAAATNIICKTGNFLDEVYLFVVNTGGRVMSYGPAGFLLFDRQKFLELGGFDPKIAFAEDVVLTRRLKRSKFGYIPGSVFTSNRRFQKMGYLRVALLWLKTAVNLFNPRFYYRDHSYWDYDVSK